MKILIIDFHKSSNNKPSFNLHWLNAKLLSEELSADLIWSYPTVNESIQSNYDIIIFNHASHYNYVDYKWLQESPNARLFYIVNEYNLGEPRPLWMAIKDGRRYSVIANHQPNISKIVKKYVLSWNVVNINSLIFNPRETIDFEKDGCIYYGSFRKNRIPSYQKYLTKEIIISTHKKNIQKFQDIGIDRNFISRIDWSKNGLSKYKYSLYLEDEITHS